MSSPQEGQEGGDKTQQTRRMRWATQRVKSVGKASNKRTGIMKRFQKNAANEKKRQSGGTDSSTDHDTPMGGVQQEVADDNTSDEVDLSARKIFFNQALPKEDADEHGHPLEHFARNKIRTARYTPLSFVPKNLFYQFHNIANVYFLFLIILAVRTLVHCFRRD